MIKYKTITVPSGTGEVLTDALAGLGQRPRKIRALTPVPLHTSGGAVSSYTLRAYVDQNQVVDYNMQSFENGLYSAVGYRDVDFRLDVDIDLTQQQGFKVGNSSGGDHFVIMEYEDK
jgi:hypothetical protein